MGEMGPTDPMSVFLNAAVLNGWKIIVDNMHNVVDVKTTSGDAGCDQYRNPAIAECANGILTLTLGAVAMDGGARNIKIEEIVISLIGGTLAVDEDDGTSGGG